MGFDPKDLAANSRRANTRYERRLAELEQKGINVDKIKATVDKTAENIAAGSKSFVIYGEPQSGKTEMMIALTAKLLDQKHRIIVLLVNDNVQLMRQNLRRFQEARLHPAPRHFEDVLPKELVLTSGEWIIFCKKNTHDLQKLTEKTRRVTDGVVVIDDEADYATPNAKINQQEQTRINQLVGDLLTPNGTYIGVTATPARLNLNNTFNNQAEKWVIFEPHAQYYGYKAFFPADYEDRHKNGTLGFRLELLPGAGDDVKYLREALFRFLVTVAHLNTAINGEEQNYCMLVHTSGIRVDHSEDYKQVLAIFSALGDAAHRSFDSYYRQLHATAEKRFPGEGDAIVAYIYQNAGRYVPVVMNSDPRSNRGSEETATNPTTPFTLAIGGNIVSRGVTFNNLLSMFFTRDVKHKIQQDTYIQRARMFGSRGAYFPHFELTIPEALYRDWNRAFLFHTLALAAIEDTGKSPLWLEDRRISAAAAGSIERATVNIQSGEMSFARFVFKPAALEPIWTANSLNSRERLKRLQTVVGTAALPDYLTSFILGLCPKGDESLAIHGPDSIADRKDPSIDKARISRTKGFIGTPQLQASLFPKAIHHIKVFTNGSGNAKVFYKYDNEGGIRFMTSKGRGARR